MTWPKRKMILAGALGAAVLVATMMASRGGETSAAAPRAGSARASAANEPDTEIPVTDLKLELLDQTRIDIGEPARNPFRFRPRPAPAAPAKPAASAPTSIPAASVTPLKPAAPPAPAGPPPISLRYIGLFEAPGPTGRVAIMSDGRGNVFQGKEGDIIEGRYRVGRVTADSLELSYVDGRGRQVIRLSGQ